MRTAGACALAALCLSLAGLLFGPGLSAPYLMTDDYALFTHFDESVPLYAGRPLAALQQGGIAALASGRLGAAPWLRLAGLVLAALAAWGAARTLARSVPDTTLAGLMGLSLLTLPGMGLYVVWLSAGHYLPALLLAIAAAALALPGEGPARPGRLAAAGACLLAALACNQAGAMLYFSLLAAALAGRALRGDCRPRRCAAPILLGLGVMALAFGLYRLGLALAPASFARAGLSLDPVGKLAWVWHEVLPNTLNLAAAEPAAWRSLLAAGVILAGLVAALCNRAPGTVAGLALAACCLPLTMAPSLAVAESWASYRTTLPLAAALFWLMLLAIATLCGRRARPLALVLAAGLLAWGGIEQVRNIREGIVAPQVAQLAVMRETLRRALAPDVGQPPAARAVRVVLCPADAPNPLPLVRYDEFGARETVLAWAAIPFARFALRLEGLPDLPVSAVSERPEAPLPLVVFVDGCGLIEEVARWQGRGP